MLERNWPRRNVLQPDNNVLQVVLRRNVLFQINNVLQVGLGRNVIQVSLMRFR